MSAMLSPNAPLPDDFAEWLRGQAPTGVDVHLDEVEGRATYRRVPRDDLVGDVAAAISSAGVGARTAIDLARIAHKDAQRLGVDGAFVAVVDGVCDAAQEFGLAIDRAGLASALEAALMREYGINLPCSDLFDDIGSLPT